MTSLQEYSEDAALVGTTFLVPPNDPLISSVARVVPVDHRNRPVEFVVASYLPPDSQGIVVSGREKDEYDKFEKGDGVYHLLPVVSAHQMRFLLDRCKLRTCEPSSNSESFQVDVLNQRMMVIALPVF